MPTPVPTPLLTPGRRASVAALAGDRAPARRPPRRHLAGRRRGGPRARPASTVGLELLTVQFDVADDPAEAVGAGEPLPSPAPSAP